MSEIFLITVFIKSLNTIFSLFISFDSVFFKVSNWLFILKGWYTLADYFSNGEDGELVRLMMIVNIL